MTDEPERPVPRATYRLQFSSDFDFAEATDLVPYLADLGVSHLYASSYLRARSGSTHGYDITDHTKLNPEIGTREDLDALSATLARHAMSQILDIVPNHVGVGGNDNPWWLDVLEWGADSPYAEYFDIDWEPAQRHLQGKVLLPFLGEQYGQALEKGDLALKFDPPSGSFAVWYFDNKFPIDPRFYDRILRRQHPGLDRMAENFAALRGQRPSLARRAMMRARADELRLELARLVASEPDIHAAVERAVASHNGEPGRPASFLRLHTLMEDQSWRASFWRVAADEINYRRFFNINGLAGLRMEQEDLFDLTHTLILELIAQGRLEGLRVDHIDGLLDPKGYCERLRAKTPRPIYLIVEKILARHEHLRGDWPIDGTTGYDFLNLVNGLFVDPAGEEDFTRLYEDFTNRRESFEDVVRDSKIHIMEHEMASELTMLAQELARIARSHWRTRDFTRNILHAALKEVIACLPVYRTYLDGGPPSEADRRDIDWAVAKARRMPNAPDPSVFDFLHAVLTTDLVHTRRSGYRRTQVARFAMRTQQYSGPVMAKGLEDTAFYRYNRLVSLNEVGGHPERFGVSVAAFHHLNAERQRHWPATMLATATHDTKRGEDTRARLNVLSEIPEEWARMVRTWHRLVRARLGDVEDAAPPDRNDEYLLYQLLLGAWPAEFGDTLPSEDALRSFTERIEEAMIKSLREAKVNSTWARPDEAYEEATLAYVRGALDVSRGNAFLDSFVPFQARIARLGMLNGLSQTLLKLTVPGVPDIYRGAELWDLSLVDPDNRRPVDWNERRRLLKAVRECPPRTPEEWAERLEHWRDGAVKLAVVWRALELRRDAPDLFRRGAYEGLTAQGAKADHVCAFTRVHEGTAAIAAVPRLVARLSADPDWLDTAIPCPQGFEGRAWHDLFTGRTVTPSTVEGQPVLTAADLFAALPLALLVVRPEGPERT